MFTQRVFAFGVLAVAATSLGLAVSPRKSAAATVRRWPSVSLSRPSERFVDDLDVTSFQRGNVHTHTRNSDGDSSPQDVYAWYRDHGYQWLAITDHNTRTNPAVYRPLERKGKFVMIPAEEITMRGAGRQVHVNALCTKAKIGWHRDATQAGALAWAVKKIHAQGAVALVNHPNWDWALSAPDLEGARGAEMLEVWSGHPFVHQDGDATHLSHEKIWDVALGMGLAFAPAAVDDAHDFRAHGRVRPAGPGRGWIQAFADAPDRAAVCDALAKKRFYASSGPALTRLRVHEGEIAVWVADAAATVEFVGKGGELLQKMLAGDGAHYALRGDEPYVRVRVTGADGKQAWTQAYAAVPKR